MGQKPLESLIIFVMKSLFLKRTSILACLVVSLGLSPAVAGVQKAGSSTVSYDDNDVRWDRKTFDTPPGTIGGQAALAPWMEYPWAMRRQRIEGRAVVSVAVDVKGEVTNISFSPRLHRDLEELVVRAVRKCRWYPGKKRGKVVAGAVSFPVTFILTAN